MDDISKKLILSDEVIMSKIYYIREQNVMLDRDLAEFYGVETKYLKRQVKRNIARFPDDFMFELSQQELNEWRSQFVTSNEDKMGLRYAPYAFTEDGVSQLSTVLKGKRAIQIHLQVMRLFGKMRRMLLAHKELLIEMENIRKKVNGQDEKINFIYNYLQQFIKAQEMPRNRIGYQLSKSKNKKKKK